jgi:hypothetical protein
MTMDSLLQTQRYVNVSLAAWGADTRVNWG